LKDIGSLSLLRPSSRFCLSDVAPMRNSSPPATYSGTRRTAPSLAEVAIEA
jgi:hypothetical protein